MMRNLLFLFLLSVLAACGFLEIESTAALVSPTTTSVPPTAIPLPPTATSVPPTTTPLPPMATAIAPTATLLPPVGFITFPSRFGDAGNFALQAGATITLTWQEAPPGADRYEFIIYPHDWDTTLILGTDTDASDGVSIAWQAPEDLTAGLRSRAYFPDGQIIFSTWAGDIYTGQTPPEGVCSLSSASIGALDVFREPDLESENFAYITPGPYAEVLERTAGGWYYIDASVAESRGNQETIPETGWVYREQGIDLHGDCDNVPLDVEK